MNEILTEFIILLHKDRDIMKLIGQNPELLSCLTKASREAKRLKTQKRVEDRWMIVSTIRDKP